MGDIENSSNSFEWYDIAPKKTFFDQLERRIFINTTGRPVKIGFGHNARRVEMIAISDGVKKDPEIAALEGEEVRE